MDKNRKALWSFKDGRDPPSIFVAKGSEKKEIQDSMDTFGREKCGPFWAYPLDGGKRLVEILNSLEICVLLARHEQSVEKDEGVTLSSRGRQ